MGSEPLDILCKFWESLISSSSAVPQAGVIVPYLRPTGNFHSLYGVGCTMQSAVHSSPSPWRSDGPVDIPASLALHFGMCCACVRRVASSCVSRHHRTRTIGRCTQGQKGCGTHQQPTRIRSSNQVHKHPAHSLKHKMDNNFD